MKQTPSFTISSLTANEPLFHYCEETHEYFLVHSDGHIEILPGVTWVLDQSGLVSPYSKDEEAAFRGLLAHKACEYLFQRRLDWGTVDPVIEPYVRSLELWIKYTGFVATRCEVRDWHRLLKFAGTFDVEGYFPNSTWIIIDLKTGQPARWHELQTAFYLLLRGGYARRGALYLQKDGTIANFREHTNEADTVKAVSLLNALRVREEFSHKA